MSATIKDIAKRLNISTSTVSYALNGGPRNVPENVRADVLRVAKELQYRPNRVARSLVTRRSNTLGVLPTEATVNLALSPYFQLCVNGILNEAEVHRNDVLIYGRLIPGVTKDQDVVTTLSDGRADGVIIIAPFVNAPFLQGLLERGVPMVVIHADVVGGVCVTCDNYHGVRQGIEHLASLGHKKIGHLAGRLSLHDGRQRKEAFEQVLRNLGLEVRQDWILETDFTPMVGYDKSKQLLQREDRPTAVFCANDELAQGFYRAAWELDLKIPEDVSVIGFDDAPLAGHLLPALTTVAQPIEKMAGEAVEMLLELVEGKEVESRSYETSLVVRGSTCPPRG